MLSAPVDILTRFPRIGAPTAQAKGLEAHGLQRAVAGQNHQIGPGNLVAILLLDRPQEAARLVQVGIVGPAVERRETLRAGGRTAAAVADAIGARAVPGHADEERAIMAVVRGPPLLRVGH